MFKEFYYHLTKKYLKYLLLLDSRLSEILLRSESITIFTIPKIKNRWHFLRGLETILMEKKICYPCGNAKKKRKKIERKYLYSVTNNRNGLESHELICCDESYAKWLKIDGKTVDLLLSLLLSRMRNRKPRRIRKCCNHWNCCNVWCQSVE